MKISFLLKRLAISILLLLGMSMLTFYLMRATPGSFFDQLRLNPQISPQTVEHYEKLYHVKDPFLVQYGYWLKNILRGELGYSFYYNVPVGDVILPRLGNTFILSLASFLLTWLVGIPLGIWAALRQGRLPDQIINMFSFASFSVPSFYLAMLLLYVFSKVGGLPLGGMQSAWADDLPWFEQVLDIGWHLIIPTIVLSVGSIGSLQRIMRGNLLAQLGQQYIIAARAKGLPESRIIYVHALRNAFNPLVTLLGYEFSALLSGAALVEIVCAWPGLGTLMLTAVRSKDVYVVMASMLLGGVLLLLGNALADILLHKLDPRIRYGKRYT